MNPVRNEELSAFLDGELTAERAEEVRKAIAVDPALRSEFDTLAGLDERLCGLAQITAFTPEITLPAEGTRDGYSWHWTMGIAVVLALLAVRFLPKVVELPLLGFGLQLAACAAVAFVIVKMAAHAHSREAGTLGSREH